VCTLKQCYPKTEEHPPYDGLRTSNHRDFIDEVTHMRDRLNIPDNEVVSKLHSRLKEVAHSWFTEVDRLCNPP
jgi:hypothetical protein